ncbi:MAG: metallophosphoesterase [Lachnospiraceae bacterium]|nr:metallophosphoesterase [Lachnospiraceae bacterium]
MAAIFTLASYAISVVNAIIIFLHATAFFLIFDLAAAVASRIWGKAASERTGRSGRPDEPNKLNEPGKPYKPNEPYKPDKQDKQDKLDKLGKPGRLKGWLERFDRLKGWLAIGVTVIYLAIGYYQDVHVWQTDYSLQTDKDLHLRIALIADSHIGTTFDGDGFAAHMKTIEAQKPDLLVVAGDFVDDASKKEDMLKACQALGSMDLRYGVWYANGNHDKGYFNDRDFTYAELEKALTDQGVHVLADSWELVDNSFYVACRQDLTFGSRKSIDELLEGVDTDKYIIVINHIPNDYDNEAASAADLVLSGHTHGGQVLPIKYTDRLFGIDDRVYGHEKRDGTDFIVTSGISNWELVFKTGTRSEYVIIDVEG